MRKLTFDTDEYYHIYNRGVDHRDIFLADTDKQRFYESLYLFNDKKHERRRGGFDIDRAMLLSGAEVFSYDRDLLMSLVGFKLMTNHYHLLVRQEQDDGISEFMHRLGTGYTNFINVKEKRSGSLFEGPFKAVHITSDAQLEHVIRYMHLNEVDRHGIPWREGRVVLTILDADNYSSHGVYCGRGQELPVVNLELAHGLFPDPEEYLEFLRSWSQSDMVHIPEDLIVCRS